MIRTGLPKEALTKAEHAHAQLSGRYESVRLWNILALDSEPTIESVDLATYTVRLGRDLAAELKDLAQIDHWQARLEGLSPSTN